ncbi:LLM class flavin-dependent oxidoreductase [Nocardia gipuzkoensis]
MRFIFHYPETAGYDGDLLDAGPLPEIAATLDTLSGGRMILGLGAGYQKSEFHALGVDFDERNAFGRRSAGGAAAALERRAVQLHRSPLQRP